MKKSTSARRDEVRSARPKPSGLAKKKVAKKATTKGREAGGQAGTAATAPSASSQARSKRRESSIAQLEQALKKIQNQDWAGGQSSLRALLEELPGEIDIRDRANAYMRVCERQLAPGEPEPKTADEFYYQGVLALNGGELDRAKTLLAKAGSKEPEADRACYALAAAMALGSEFEPALAQLKRAIELNGDNRIHARNDQHFELLRDEPGFLQLVGLGGRETA